MITTTMTLNTYRSISLLLLSYNRPGSLCRRLAASVVFDLIESRRGTVIADAYTGQVSTALCPRKPVSCVVMLTSCRLLWPRVAVRIV